MFKRVNIPLCSSLVFSRLLGDAVWKFSSRNKHWFLSDRGNSPFLFSNSTKALVCHGTANAKLSTCCGLNIAYSIQCQLLFFRTTGQVLSFIQRIIFFSLACLWYFLKQKFFEVAQRFGITGVASEELDYWALHTHITHLPWGYNLSVYTQTAWKFIL